MYCFFCHLAKGSPFVLVIMSVYPTESQGRVQDFSFFNIFNSSRYCRNQSQYRFVFARPNNKVMTAALTRSYEKNCTVLRRSQNRTAEGN